MSTGSTRTDDALVDRLVTLRTLVPALVTEVAVARRENARLRRENAELQTRLAMSDRLESDPSVSTPLTPVPTMFSGV